MMLFEECANKQRVFEQTGEFTSAHPTVVAPLGPEVFLDADMLEPDIDRYRPIAIETLVFGSLTHFRRVTGGHSGSMVRGTPERVIREEPTIRAGVIGRNHWSTSKATGGEPTTDVMRPHIDDSFLCAALTYFAVVGQPLLHYPGTYTLDLGRLRDQGIRTSERLLELWRSRDNYRVFAQTLSRDDDLRHELLDLFAVQVGLKAVTPVEAPVDCIFVVDNHFLHSENDQTLAAGSFRGIIRQFAST